MKSYQRKAIKTASILGVILLVIIVNFSVKISSSDAHAKRLHHERYYQEIWCAERGGVTEYQLPSRTRVDCLTGTEAVEADFASKWYEAIGQSLYYAMETGKQAAILLIIETPKDLIYFERMQETIMYHKLPITVYTIGRGAK